MSKIDDAELVWRSVHPQFIVASDVGVCKLSSQAFNDPGHKPSVDRQNIRLDPILSKRGDDHGIVQLHVERIRAIPDIKKMPPKKPIIDYAIDVIADPITEPPNPSHALISSAPAIDSRPVFDRLKDRLSRLAEINGWILPPQ